MTPTTANLKHENVQDAHTMFKLLKTQKVSYSDFTVDQIYDLKKAYGRLFDEEFNNVPKTYPENSKILSQSAVKTFKSCPRFWYLQYIKHATKEVGDDTWLKFGSVIHLILSKFYDEIDIEVAKQDPESHFMYVLKLLGNQNWDYSLDRKLYNKDAMEIFENFAHVFGNRFTELNKSNNLDTFSPISTEEEIFATSYPLRSIIDRINPGLKTFADYKTNKAFPSILLRPQSSLNNEEINLYNITAEDYAIQAVINAICIYDKYKVLPKMCLFIFLRHLREPHGGIVPIQITQNLIDQVVGYINEVYTAMKSGVYPKTSTPANCSSYGGCEYMTVCDAQEQCILNL